MVENELTSKATEIGSLKQRLAIDNLNLNRTMGTSNSDETYQHGPSLTSVEQDLRELCHIFAVNFTDAHTSRPKTEVIISMLNALKPALMSLISTHDGDIQQERGEIHELKSQIEDARQRILDTSTKLIGETSAKKVLERKCIEFESQLLQSQSVHQKLEFKYENAKTEIADCQQLAIELKKIVVGKVRVHLLCQNTAF